ncbi:MAG: FkbM family methyltransferase [Acidobacteria bacterium]|nr:FkbM family methyltransferase [Acidobacteriota bacterium]
MTFSNKDLIGRYLYVEGEFDYDTMGLAFQRLKDLGRLKDQNKTLLDIGANIGTVCIPMIRDGWFERALAFEPEPFNYSLLKKNTRQNHLNDKILTYQIALASRNTDLKLKKSTDNFGDHRIVEHQRDASDTIQISGRTLDSFLEESTIPIEDISLLWMDVQGYEPHVLEGARTLLKRNIPFVLEFWPEGMVETKSDAENFVETLQKSFTHYIDLSEEKAPKHPISKVPQLYEIYRGGKFTDLLLI